MNLYPRFHYRNRYRVKRRNPLTYVIGARCTDGVVIVADRRIWKETEYEEGDKIFKVKNMVVGSAGFRGIMEHFNEKLSENLKDGMKLQEIKELMEDIVLHLNTRYRPRFISTIPNADENNFSLIENLVAINDGNKTKLFHINPNGYVESVEKYLAIGHGEPYGAVFLKKTWEIIWKNKEYPKTMEPIANLLAFSVLMVQTLEVDNSVGNGFNVWVIPDEGTPRELTEKEYEKFMKDINAMASFVDLGQWYDEKGMPPSDKIDTFDHTKPNHW